MPNLYNVKEYQDLVNQQTEFYYDTNGNLITDLDRNIVTIKYNLLNLPELIQFGNGRQMKNTYTANGQKLRTEYFTPIVSVAVPVGSTTDLSAANRRKTEINYIGNKEYEIDHWGYHSLKRLHNSEGYIDFEVGDNSFYFDPRYNYYRRDHLGNTREVWQAPYLVHYRMTATMWGQEEIPQSTVQRTQYYPSGLPWEEGLGQNQQPYKFGGKEFIEMHGLDEYDFHARGYYPAIMRFNTMDPLAEKYYSISPYAYVMNNPIRYIDPDGKRVRPAQNNNYRPNNNYNRYGLYPNSQRPNSYQMTTTARYQTREIINEQHSYVENFNAGNNNTVQISTNNPRGQIVSLIVNLADAVVQDVKKVYFMDYGQKEDKYTAVSFSSPATNLQFFTAQTTYDAEFNEKASRVFNEVNSLDNLFPSEKLQKNF